MAGWLWQRCLRIGAVGLACALAAIAVVQAAPPATSEGGKGAAAVSPVKALLAEEANALERDIAARMMRRSSATWSSPK